MKRTAALLRSRAAIQDARELRQEVAQYGHRKPAPFKNVTIIIRRPNQPDRRIVYS